eukprot:TRINITY_DN2555_c0_g1_i1.p1 TRINITY_DN2555_c0_g1~~TRINITY_DN2555_c0_g1_i1.p1  ORF type:complete len:601 (+),score=161.82 TRINITY_DN2555_c0_g1_i1:130-1932(+)
MDDERAVPSSPLASAPTWTKTHQLEGDGLLPLLFHHLGKKNKNFLSCPEVKIPDTVVYEQNFPRAWYTYDFKNYEITKKAGRFLDAHHIYQTFSKTDAGCDICAQFSCTTGQMHGEEEGNQFEFFRPADLHSFLHERKVRPDGILQKFKVPTSTRNAQIQVIWSPRLCMIQRRMNKNRMSDRTLPPDQRAVTYDGPPHLSEEGLCSEQTKALLLRMCSAIVEHFMSTEHKPIARFVLYFKVSPIPRQAAIDGHNSLWLLWGSSLRVGDAAKQRQQSSPARSGCRPLTLSPNISVCDPSLLHGSSTLDDVLDSADREQRALASGKWIQPRAPAAHRQTPPSNTLRRSCQGPSQDDLEGSIPRPPDRSPRNGSREMESDVPTLQRMGSRPIAKFRSVARASRLWGTPSSRPSTPGAGDAEPMTPTSVGGMACKPPQLQQAVKAAEKTLTVWADDVFYSIYSHTLRNQGRPFTHVVPPYVKAALRVVDDKTLLQELLGGVVGMTPVDDAASNLLDLGAAAESDPHDVWILPPGLTPPFGRQSDEARKVVIAAVQKVDGGVASSEASPLHYPQTPDAREDPAPPRRNESRRTMRSWGTRHSLLR